MIRPALKRLLADIDSGRIDIIVVYKIDRLTRSLADFARMVEIFEARTVSFVAVTQSFNTTTSMGRLTLNVLLSFAQFEREVTGERIRDKIAASKKRGLWMGGNPPLGYDVIDKRLVVNESEAETVRTLFTLYPRHGSVRALKAAADAAGLRSKKRRARDGRMTGGIPFTRGHLYRLLANPIYRGRIAQGRETYPGQHEPIIDEALWHGVEARLKANRAPSRRRTTTIEASRLAGLIRDETGDRLSPSHASKSGRRYRYYISHRLMREKRYEGEGWRLPARALERAVEGALAAWLEDTPRLIAALSHERLAPAGMASVIAAAHRICAQLRAGDSQGWEAVRGVIDGIVVAPGCLTLSLARDGLRRLIGALPQGGVMAAECAIANPIAVAAATDGWRVALESNAPEGTEPGGDATLTITAPFAIKRRGVEAKLVLGGDAAANHVAPDPKLVDVLVQAHRVWRRLTSGAASSIDAIARACGRPPCEVTRILPLALLAPDITAAILEGRQPVDLTAERLKRLSPLPLAWPEQR